MEIANALVASNKTDPKIKSTILNTKNKSERSDGKTTTTALNVKLAVHIEVQAKNKVSQMYQDEQKDRFMFDSKST